MAKAKRVLIVVDYQNDFVDGALGFPGAEKLEAPIAERIAKELAAGGEIIFTLDTHEENYLDTAEGKKLPIPHCIRGTEGHRITEGLLPYLDRAVLVLEKPSFGSLTLGAFLREKDYARVELCGLVSSICVLSNAVIAKAALPEAEIVVDTALTAAPDPAAHEAAMAALGGIQITVI